MASSLLVGVSSLLELIEFFHLMFNFNDGLMMLIKYSPCSNGSFCEYLEGLVLERRLSSSKSELTRFGLVSWLQLRLNQGGHLFAAMAFLLFFAIKPSFHFYLYFTVRNFIDVVLRFFGFRFKWNQPLKINIYWFYSLLDALINRQYFKRKFDTWTEPFSDLLPGSQNLIVTFINI